MPWCPGATGERKEDKNKCWPWGWAGIVHPRGPVVQLETETLVKSVLRDSGTQCLPELIMSSEVYPPTLLPHRLMSLSKNNNGMWVGRSEIGYLWVQCKGKPKGRGMRSRHRRQERQVRFRARAMQSQDSNPDSITGASTHPTVAIATLAILHRSIFYGKAIHLP